MKYPSVIVLNCPSVKSSTGPVAVNSPAVLQMISVESVGQMRGMMTLNSSLVIPMPSNFPYSITSSGMR